MVRLNKWILFALLTLLFPLDWAESQTDFTPATPESQGLSKDALDALAATVEEYVASDRIVGATLLVVKNRRTVLHEAYGWQDREEKIPMKRDTIFNIRSMTKPLTGTAIQMLIDEEKLSVDDPVCKYIPSFDKEPLDGITIDHLLTHRSGLPLGPIMASFNQFDSIGEVAARAAEVGVSSEPGSVFRYSDPGSDTLGAVLAAVTAEPIGTFFQKRIFDPLGMNDTINLVDADDPRRKRIASLYMGQEREWYRIWKPEAPPLYPFTYGSQSVYSTAMDYARFLALWIDRGLAGGERLLSEGAVKRAFSPRSPMEYPNGFSGTTIHYGQMWMLYMDAGFEGAPSAQSGPVLFGHGGSDGTLAWAWPDRDLMVLYFSQSRGQRAGIELDAVVDRLLIAPEREKVTPEERELNVESFDYVWNRVNERYWDPEFGGIDWMAVRDDLRPQVEKAATMKSVRALMEEAVGRLGASHFAIIPSEVYEKLDSPEQPGSWEGVTGLDFRVIDGHALVTVVTDGAAAHAAGVRPGWEIVGIDDFDVLARVGDLDARIEQNLTKPFRLWGTVASRLRGPVGKELELSFIDGKGQEVSRSITLAQERGWKVTFGHFPDFRVWIDVRTIDDGIGYIAFNGFFDPAHVMTAFNDAMRSFKDARGVIIDIRGNGGGLGEMCLGMMGWLIQDECRHLGTAVARDLELKILVNPRTENYSGPVAVLVDGLSGSSSEVFASGLQDLGRACIVGSPTGGAVLGCCLERLPNGDGFEYADSTYISLKRGSAIEGAGVVPDIEVIPTREALLTGRDPVIDAAVRWIGEQTYQSTE